MSKITLLAVLTVVLIAFTAAFWMRHQTHSPALEPDVIERSKQYIYRLGDKPLSELNREEKLLLLHSYSNLGKNRLVVGMGSQMIEDFQSLPTERQTAFVGMVTNAYRQLGRDQEAQAFSQKVAD